MNHSTNFLNNSILNLVFRGIDSLSGSKWMALYNTSPCATGIEVSGGSYSRVAAPSFSSPTGGQTSNSTQITFPEASGSWTNINYVAITSASVSGSALFYSAISTSKPLDSGDIFDISSGSLVITLSGNYSDTLLTYLLNHILNGSAYPLSSSDVYAALFSTVSGSGTEISAGDYSRKQLGGTSKWDAPVNGYTANTGDVSFVTSASADWGMISSFALYDQSTGGTLLFYHNFDNPFAIVQGDGLIFSAGEIQVQLT